MATVEREDLVQPRALRASTLGEAFLRTASERADHVALRTPRDRTTITWREYRERVERIAAGLAGPGRAGGPRRATRRWRRADAAQPARVPPGRHGRAAARGHAVLDLQHLD